MRTLICCLVVSLLAGCSIDRTITQLSVNENDLLKTFQNIPAESRVKIADDNEPGERLLLCLTLVEKESKKILTGQKISFYHTDVSGNYHPANQADETTARLNATAISDSRGCVFVETILPGDYGSSPDNRHIHTTVHKAHPEAYDIHFKQYTSFMGKRFSKGSDQHFIADLKRSGIEHLVTFVTIEVKKPVLP